MFVHIVASRVSIVVWLLVQRFCVFWPSVSSTITSTYV